MIKVLFKDGQKNCFNREGKMPSFYAILGWLFTPHPIFVMCQVP